MNVRKIWVTPDAEAMIEYCARVSSKDQTSSNPRLLRYLVEHGHWSPFEMASMCVEIETSRAIGRQILRHRSFSFQEFSQRYTTKTDYQGVSPRKAGSANRQGSVDGLDPAVDRWFMDRVQDVIQIADAIYDEAIKKGIAKESARFILPECATTRLYMAGTMRSWIHYVQLRVAPDTQQEHREIARAIEHMLVHELPATMEALAELEQDRQPVEDLKLR